MKLFLEYRNLSRNNHILFFGRMMTALGSMVFSMLTLILSQKLGMDATTIAMVMFLYGLCNVPLALTGGKLADRFSRKKIIVLCDLCSIVACFYTAMVSLSYVSLVVFALGTLLQSMEWSSYTALIADLTPSDQREQAYSLNYLGTNLGMILSPTLAGILFQNHLPVMFVLQGTAIGISTLLIWLFLDESQTYENDNVYEQAQESVSLWQVIKENRLVIFFVVLLALYFAVYNQYQYLLPLDMGSIHGEHGALIFGTVSSINCFTVVVCTPILTKLFSKWMDIRKVALGSMTVTAGYLMYLITRSFVPGYYLVMIVFTWGEILQSISMDSYVTRRVPSSHTGRIVALESVTQSIFMGVFQVAVGWIYDLSGAVPTWAVVIGTGVITTVLLAVLAGMDRKTYPQLYVDKPQAK